ncbi:MAG: hypothetical protein WCT14_13870 [Treponemataceae bacterium]
MKKPLFVAFLLVSLTAFAFASNDAIDDDENDSSDTEAVADDADDEGDEEADAEDGGDAEDGENDQDSETDASAAASPVESRQLSETEIADIVTILNDMYDSTDRFITELSAADNAPAAAGAIRRYAREMERLRDQVKSMSEALSSVANGGNAPAEVRQGLERLNSLSARMEPVSLKIQQFATDQEVMDAIKALSEVSS